MNQLVTLAGSRAPCPDRSGGRACLLPLPGILRRADPEPEHKALLPARRGRLPGLARGAWRDVDHRGRVTACRGLCRGAGPRSAPTVWPRPSSSAWPRSAACSTGWPRAGCCPSTRPRPCAGRSHSAKVGKTPVLDPQEARQLTRRDRHDDAGRIARPGPDRVDGLLLRPGRRGARHEGRGRVHAETAGSGCG